MTRWEYFLRQIYSTPNILYDQYKYSHRCYWLSWWFEKIRELKVFIIFKRCRCDLLIDKSSCLIQYGINDLQKVLQRIVYFFLLQVTYQTDLFLDKNIDYAVNEHQVLLNASKCSFVSSLFPPCEESTKSTKFTSIGSNFKVNRNAFIALSFNIVLTLNFFLILQQQLQSLLETLSATEPHHIRCVKPNNVLKPAIFENSNVLQQLRCGVSCALTCIILIEKIYKDTVGTMLNITDWTVLFMNWNAPSCDTGSVETSCHSFMCQLVF